MPEPSRPKRSLASKTSWSATANFTATFSAAVSGILVARLLGPQGAGEVAYAFWVTSTVSVLTGLGLAQSATRYLAEQGAAGGGNPEGLARWLYRRGVATLLLAIPVLLLWMRFGARQPYSVAATLTLGVLLGGQVLGGAFISTRTGFQDFRQVAILNLVSAVLQIIGVTVGAKLYGVAGALGGYALGTLGPAWTGLRLLGMRGVGRPEPVLRQRVLRYSIQTWAAAVVSLFAWSRLEVFFLDQSWGKHGVAMFTVALTLAQLATQGPTLLGSALVPHFSELAGADQLESIKSTYAMATRILAFVAFPLCFGMAAVSPVLLPLLFGRAFADAVPNAMVLIPFAAIGAVAGVGSAMVYALERSRFIAVSGIASAVLALGAFVWAIPVWGAWGAVWARGLVQLVSVGMGVAYIAWHLKVPVPLVGLSRIAAAAALSAVAAFACVRLIPGAVPALVIAAVTMTALYLLLSRVLRSLDGSELVRLEALFASTPGGMGGPARFLLAWLRG
jgi:O-antigen/teichoic acid export membrane protein